MIFVTQQGELLLVKEAAQVLNCKAGCAAGLIGGTVKTG